MVLLGAPEWLAPSFNRTAPASLAPSPCRRGGAMLRETGMEAAAPAMLAPSSLGRRQHGWRPPPATSVRVCHGGRRTAPERLAPSRWMTAPATLAPQKGPFLG
ncbi:B1148D12.13 [Oryza sativa (japonica cultivar-group)]